MKKLMLVYNPRSSHYVRVKAEVLSVARKLSGWMVGKFEVKPTSLKDNAGTLAKLLGDGDLVIAVGGDGTASIAANAVMLSGKRATLGVLGYGNFNDMAMTFGVERPVAYGDEYLGGITEIVNKFEANETERVWPLEVLVDDKHWRYAMCYVTCGMLAASTVVFDEKEVREKLRTGKRGMLFSWLTAAGWYFRNHKKRKFLPEVTLNGEEVPAGATDYVAMNSDRMARIMRGKRWYLEKTEFASATFSLSGLWGLVKLMLRSLRKTPVKVTQGDVLELAEPGELEMQVEGEYQKLEGVTKVEVRKAEGALRVIRK